MHGATDEPVADIMNCTHLPSCPSVVLHQGNSVHNVGHSTSPVDGSVTDVHEYMMEDDLSRGHISGTLPLVSRGEDVSNSTNWLDDIASIQHVVRRVDAFRQVALSLHYVSIAILGFLLLEASDHCVTLSYNSFNIIF